MPSVGECRAFFGHFARGGRPSFNGPRSILRPDYPGRASPDSEPRGTVAILCEIAIDRVAAHDREGASGQDLASTATVRHASSQIRTLFNRTETAGPHRLASIGTTVSFARTLSSTKPPRAGVSISRRKGEDPSSSFSTRLRRLRRRPRRTRLERQIWPSASETRPIRT